MPPKLAVGGVYPFAPWTEQPEPSIQALSLAFHLQPKCCKNVIRNRSMAVGVSRIGTMLSL